ILQVVRVLPDVEAHDDLLVFHERTVLVRAALDRQLAAVVDQPRPAAAEAADAGFLEFFLEFVEAAERGLDRIGNRAARRPAGLRPHDLQNIEGFACPPPLLRTAVRISSGTRLMP